MSTNCGRYSVEKVSNFVFCIRENEDLLLYLICGNEKAALIDTGTGNGNLYEFIQQNNLLKNKQKLIVLNTHNHAKQTGANWQFSAIGKVGKAHCVEDLCASGADKTYTRLLDSSFDWQVKPYKITRWLQNGEVIRLGGNVDLTVHFAPGHTPDSIFLVLPIDNRIFLGDTFHQFEDVLLTYERSSIKQLIQTMARILDLIQRSPNKAAMRYSASKNDTNELCLPVLKNYQRFLFGIVAGIQREIPLRIDEQNGSRFETRDKLIKIVLSPQILAQLRAARTARDDSSLQSSAAESLASTF